MARNALLVSALLALVALPSAALADKKAEAEAYVTLAKAAFGKGKFSQCAAHFGSAYELDPLPKYLFNVGLCHEKAGELDSALSAFKRYLKVAPKGEKAGEAGTRAELLELKLQAERQKQLEAEREKERDAEARSNDETERQKQVEAERQRLLELQRQRQLEAQRQQQLENERRLKEQGLLGGATRSPETRVVSNTPATVKKRPKASKSSAYGSTFRENTAHIRIGLGLGSQSDDTNALPLIKFSFRGQFPLGSYLEKKPNSVSFGFDMIYSAIEGFTPMSLALRYNVPVLHLRAYGEIMAGMQIETENDEDTAGIGLDLPLRLGMELPIGFHALGLEGNFRPLDGTNGFALTYNYNFF